MAFWVCCKKKKNAFQTNLKNNPKKRINMYEAHLVV